MRKEGTAVFADCNDFSTLMSLLSRDGIVIFKGIASMNDLVRLSNKIGKPIQHRDADANGIITLRPREDEQEETFKGYTHKEQYVHTDGTMVENPADIVVLYCEMPAKKGGESTFVDGRELHRKLKREDPGLLAALMEKDAGIFGDSTADRKIKAIFKHYGTNRMSICFRNDKLVSYSKMIQDKFAYLIATIGSLTSRIKLNSGEGYIVNNHRFIHGRDSFEGDRIIHRVQLHSHRSNGILSGFVP